MKLLTVCIPCMNDIVYMHKTITSCLLMKEELQIILVVNPSDDETYDVALEYAKAYPETIDVIYNENEDDIVDTAMQKCKGLYFKTLACAHYFDQPSLVKVVETIRDFIRIQANLDVLFTDYKYVVPEKKDRVISFKNLFPTETIFSWHNMKLFRKTKFSSEGTILKTSILKKIYAQAKNHKYKQDLILYNIIPCMKSMYYLDMPLYCKDYDEKEELLPLEEAMNILKTLWNAYDIFALKSRRQRRFAIDYLAKKYVDVLYLMVQQNQLDEKDQFNAELECMNEKLYKAVTRELFGVLLNADNAKFQLVVSRLYKKLNDYE